MLEAREPRLTRCVPADNYLVSSESSIYCAEAFTGKQGMSSWLPIVIGGLKACRYTTNSPLIRLTVIYTIYRHKMDHSTFYTPDMIKGPTLYPFANLCFLHPQ